jgi:hypothetical protein
MVLQILRFYSLKDLVVRQKTISERMEYLTCHKIINNYDKFNQLSVHTKQLWHFSKLLHAMTNKVSSFTMILSVKDGTDIPIKSYNTIS